jgi:hypothetical protein
MTVAEANQLAKMQFNAGNTHDMGLASHASVMMLFVHFVLQNLPSSHDPTAPQECRPNHHLSGLAKSGSAQLGSLSCAGKELTTNCKP